MTMPQRLEETKPIKTEIIDDDVKLSLYNTEIENAESVLLVKEVKNEALVVDYANSKLETSLPVYKSDDIDEKPRFNYIRHETCSLFEIPESFTTLKYEIKSEDVDISYSSLYSKKDVDLPSTASATEASDNLCSNKKQCQKSEANQLRTGTSNFGSEITQGGKDITFNCFHCDYSTDLKRNLVNHIKLVHDKKITKLFSCTNCDYSTRYKQVLARHVTTVHLKSDKTNSCAGCEKTFREKVSLDNHIIKNHQHLIHLVSSKVYNCSTCDFKSTQRSNLNKHTTSIHLKKSCACMYCEKHFARQSTLDDHIIKNHRNVPASVSSKVFSCPTCDYKTTNKSHLRRHTVKVHLEKININSRSNKVYNCPTCDYKTTVMGNFKQHTMEVHPERYKFMCTCCEKHYTTKHHLDDHILKKHRNLIDLVSSKVHSCTICNYKTTLKNLLDYYRIKGHSGNNNKKLACRFCAKHYKLKMCLDDHIIKNHQDFINLVTSKIYNCPICDYKTTVKDLLTRHRIKVHS